MNTLVLASGSPRRLQLLESFGYACTVIKSTIEETMDETMSPEHIAQELALSKAQDVQRTLDEPRVILAADTLVSQNGRLFGKPGTIDEARACLQLFSGSVHQVTTGVAICDGSQQQLFYQTTDVEFWRLTEEDIERYISTKEPYDKAGGYGIQGMGGLFVKSIKGDYYTVVGLPIAAVYRHLKDFGCLPLVSVDN
ncbi:Maf family protein [Aureibacillus halotolerans]|uniref:dTTP/UTP pyrophosphatase n=1 Tax=Aureibacillus halotolerans TaxID=1508390 RepID=A0A4R6TVV9_9BACI|nr:Maf family protein [Aureibacillus halotolerans]TDQ37958.1 septum formation protein [Aureibacillus halotolerans]